MGPSTGSGQRSKNNFSRHGEANGTGCFLTGDTGGLENSARNRKPRAKHSGAVKNTEWPIGPAGSAVLSAPVFFYVRFQSVTEGGGGGGGGGGRENLAFELFRVVSFLPFFKCLYLNGMLKMCLTELS